MWIWDGVIGPEPGENIEDAAKEAINIAGRYGGGCQAANCYFQFDFNSITLRAYPWSKPQDIVAEYFKRIRGV